MRELFDPGLPERLNMADYYLDARVREGRGERAAVKVGDRTWTYAEVKELADRCANALRARGVDAEDRVLFLLFDGIDFVTTFFGTLKAGGVFCMGNPLLSEADFDYLLEYTGARAVVADVGTLDRLAPALARHPRCRVRLAAGEGALPEGFERFDEVLAAASADPYTHDTHGDDVAGWLFTSGTTGKPKGAVHLHRHFPFNTECYAKRVLALDEDDVFVSVSRLFFGYATGTNLMFPFAVGGCAVLFPDKPTPELLFDHIERHRVTVLTNVPAMIRKMLDDESAPTRDLSSLRMCLSAGEALPASLYERWTARWPVEILDGIGSAEMFHIYITNYPGDVKLGSLGRLVPGYDARVVGPDGDDVPDGEIGRLWIRGASAALCYWRDQRKSHDVFRGEWTVSADLFRREGDYFYYAGRGDDMLKVRGMFVSPLEIEDCLATHPAVREAAVIGIDDGAGLTVPKAFVALRDGHAPSDALVEALQQHAKTKLARYKFPHEVAFVDALPRNDRGKVVRRALSAPST